MLFEYALFSDVGLWTYCALACVVAFAVHALVLVPAPRSTDAASASKEVAAVIARSKVAYDAEIAALTDSERAMLAQLRDLLAKADAGSPECNADEARCTAILRSMIAAGLLDLSLVESAPSYLEHVHRTLVELSATSLFVKVTVHCNLFLGSIVALANDTQRSEVVAQVSSAHCFGSFGLTEQGAGVTSGLVVDSTAHYDAARRAFVLNSGPKGQKNWISNGHSAYYMLIFARTFVGPIDRGIQIFLLSDLQDSPSFQRNYVDEKHHLKGLDNVTVKLTDHVVPASSMLDRLTPLSQLLDSASSFKPVPFLTLANRLLSGRVFISIATLDYFNARLALVYAHLRDRPIELMGSPMALFALEHNYSLLDRLARVSEMLSHYVAGVKRSYYAALLAPGSTIDEALQQRINICKALIPHFALVGTYALKSLAGSAAFFTALRLDESINVLYAAKIAEGDDRIMAVKLAMDALRGFNKASVPAKVAQTCIALMMHSKRPFAWNLLRLARAFFGVQRKAMAAVYARNTGLISRTGVWAAWAAVYAQWEADGKTKRGVQWAEVQEFVESRFLA